MTNDERLAEARAYGERLAKDTLASMDEALIRANRIGLYLGNKEAAQRHVQASGGSEQDAMRLVFDSGEKALEHPRPRLVWSRD